MESEEDILTKKLGDLELESEHIEVKVNGKSLICDGALVLKKCKYFQAYSQFNSNYSKSIEFKGVLSYETCKLIFEYLQSGTLDIDTENFQDVLEGSLFLQCTSAEEEAVKFIASQLGKDNAFRIYSFARSMGSKLLANTVCFYIGKVFPMVMGSNGSTSLNEFLDFSFLQVNDLVKADNQISEDLLLYSLLGWIDYDDSRKDQGNQLLMKINTFLLGQTTLTGLLDEEGFADDYPELIKNINESLRVKKLYINDQLTFWKNKNPGQTVRWPQILITASTGNRQGCLNWIDLKSTIPTWHTLTKKPSDIAKKATGSCMLYLHPKLFFLGGEKNWQLTWYDLEHNKWGVCQGVAPGRLLSGGSVLSNALYVVGGVNFEQWAGTRGATGQVITSSAVDRYRYDTEKWEPVCPLDEGRSSPGVVTVDDRLYVLGGLKKRHILNSCCFYNPLKDKWKDLPDLPEPLVNFSCLVEKDSSSGPQIWIFGGMGQDYQCKTVAYIFNVQTSKWTKGPSLNHARKCAFSFVFNRSIYVCGGSTDGLTYLSSVEVLDEKRKEFRTETLGQKSWNSNMVAVTALQPIRLLNQK